MKDKNYLKSVERAASFIRARAGSLKPKVVVILGSGLNAALPKLVRTKTIEYSKIPGFPKSTVSGHAGRLVLGVYPRRKGGPLGVAVMMGRFHYYEGYPMSEITLPLRALRKAGVETVVLTAAVGSLRNTLKPGHVCVLNDHINFMGFNPLRGVHTSEYGPTMFPDLGGAYDPALRKIALAACRRNKLPAREGVYVAPPGPSYESPAEIRAFRILGGDVVGMSTVPEVIVAKQIEMRMLALAWISNMAAGMTANPLTHTEVLALGEKVAGRLRGLFEALFSEL